MVVGRFAPSPTGPLHFGSLVAAVASYCDAKAQGGKWLLRMEDLDKPREMAGAADDIIRTLTAYGFEWDGEIIYQSLRSEIYQRYLEQLVAQGLVYPCTCSRKEIADSSTSIGIEGAIYPGTCRENLSHPDKTPAWRIKVDALTIQFNDRAFGFMQHQLANDIGDFVLKRTDGLFTYQLAVVVDDAEQGVTDVVRGADLLNSTTRQIYLQQTLNLPTPRYLHIPVVTNAAGEKLSKQTLASAIDPHHANNTLFEALTFLGQHPPLEIKNAILDEVWRWAIANWQTSYLEHRAQVKSHTSHLVE